MLPLQDAAHKGDVELLTKLLDEGADVNQPDEGELCWVKRH